MKKILNGESISLGTCYYPEHWDESMWEEDLNRMKANGIKTIRIAEFAWSKTEPAEGVYTFDFFDRFLDLCEKVDMQVIFCTPTATAPAWLTENYPEVLNCDVDGHPFHHGERQQTNYTSKVYQHFSRVITEKIAEHYAKRPCIIGWQLDNEFNCGISEFHSESDTKEFRVFLRRKYQNIDALNKAWGTAFWNQTYTTFEEIHVPRRTINASYNPHLVLDYKRFISDVTCKFAKEQADIIRKYMKPDDFITTNGIFGNIDYKRMMDETLDEITYDSYPDFAYEIDKFKNEGLLDRNNSESVARLRAIKPVFGIMEQQSGANGWNTRMEAPTPRPGQLSLWTMQSIMNGADYVSYFRWRTCTYGTEMYWHGILDYSSRDNRRLREVKKVSEDIAKMQDISGCIYEAKVGYLQDYDNDWDADFDRWHKRIADPSKKAFFEALQKMHVPYDYINMYDEKPVEELLKYDILFYPHPEILNKKRMDVLTAYVNRGGKLVFGCRTGQKDMNGICTQEKLPGLARDLTKADVLEYSLVAPDEAPSFVTWNGKTFEAAVFNEVLASLPGGEVLATYDNTYIAGEPALIKSTEGLGEVYYFGAGFSKEAVEAFVENLGASDPYGDIITAPEEVEIGVRSNDKNRFMFVLNYMKEEQKVTFKKPVVNILTGETLSGEVVMPKISYLIVKL